MERAASLPELSISSRALAAIKQPLVTSTKLKEGISNHGLFEDLPLSGHLVHAKPVILRCTEACLE
jgi:hypothetical protein